jgi:hypothetical protein
VKILHFSFKKITLMFCRKEKAITFAAAFRAKFIGRGLRGSNRRMILTIKGWLSLERAKKL